MRVEDVILDIAPNEWYIAVRPVEAVNGLQGAIVIKYGAHPYRYDIYWIYEEAVQSLNSFHALAFEDASYSLSRESVKLYLQEALGEVTYPRVAYGTLVDVYRSEFEQGGESPLEG